MSHMSHKNVVYELEEEMNQNGSIGNDFYLYI